ncbi:MAG TPA: phosphoenolpyruvate--protein phosphotransferase [Steroidobacter sp.]
MTTLTVLAPLQGWCAPLEEAPDPVFAERLLGPGVAIDPVEGVLHAPCEGEIISVAATKHAIAIRAENGAELLLHVGIDTVALGGEGFEVLVSGGRRVRAGEPLLRFDLDALAGRAKSLLTPIVVTNGEQFSIARANTDRLLRVGEELMQLTRVAASERISEATADEARETFRMPLEHGLHARPAAVIAAFAKTVSADIKLAAHGRSANARSAVGLMSLGVRRADEVTVIVSGTQAQRIASELKERILQMPQPAEAETRSSGESVAPSHASPTSMQKGRSTKSADGGERLRGVIASRGLAVGRAATLRAPEIQVEEMGRGVAHESAELERARAEVRERLEHLARHSQSTAREVISAHLEFLDDWEVVAAARRAISRGKSAAFAWRAAIRESADALRALGDARMAERIDDLLDLETQVLSALKGEAPVTLRKLPEGSVLIAEDLKPSQLVALDTSELAGLCMAAGGPTSHVAILAAAMGVPALVALGPRVLGIEDGTPLILDAEQGWLTVAPDQAAWSAAEQAVSARQQRKQIERAAALADCRSADGVRVEVFANLGSLTEAQVAVTHGAEGCGLLRTEFLFLDRDSPPGEEEQWHEYQAIADALANRPLVIRTLDVGGDKAIPYLPLPPEENPALGLRGVRTSLWRPDLLKAQLRAIVRVRPMGQCRVLLPMITDPAELRAVRRLLEEVRRELDVQEEIEIGVMVETPACALMAERIARDVSFLSIGTNDLTQYTLAMDRGHSELAHRMDGLHPSVLRLIAMTVRGAEEHSRLVAVCGGLAADPQAVPVLLGLGVRELSVVPTSVPQLKSLIRTLSIDRCRKLAAEALQLDSAEGVRALVKDFSLALSRVAS